MVNEGTEKVPTTEYLENECRPLFVKRIERSIARRAISEKGHSFNLQIKHEELFPTCENFWQQRKKYYNQNPATGVEKGI